MPKDTKRYCRGENKHLQCSRPENIAIAQAQKNIIWLAKVGGSSPSWRTKQYRHPSWVSILFFELYRRDSNPKGHLFIFFLPNPQTLKLKSKYENLLQETRIHHYLSKVFKVKWTLFFKLKDNFFSPSTFLCGLQPFVRKKCIKSYDVFYGSHIPRRSGNKNENRPINRICRSNC